MGPRANTEDGQREMKTAWTRRALLRPNHSPPCLCAAHVQCCTEALRAPASRNGSGRSTPCSLICNGSVLKGSIMIYYLYN